MSNTQIMTAEDIRDFGVTHIAQHLARTNPEQVKTLLKKFQQAYPLQVDVVPLVLMRRPDFFPGDTPEQKLDSITKEVRQCALGGIFSWPDAYYILTVAAHNLRLNPQAVSNMFSALKAARMNADPMNNGSAAAASEAKEDLAVLLEHCQLECTYC